MKTLNMKAPKFIAFTAILLLAACTTENRQTAEVNTTAEVKTEKENTADIADVSFVDGMTGKAFQNYLHLEETLFNSDLAAAKEAAENLAETFSSDQSTLKSVATQMAESKDLETLRAHFFTFSQEAESFFSEGLATGTIYKQYCPMAFDNEGAFWIADVKKINNPYFGASMAHCGKTIETVSK